MNLQLIFITYVAIVSPFFVSAATNRTIGFTIDLIHRDSPQSPTYDPSISPSQRLSNALQRSLNRLHRFNANYSNKSPVSDINSVNGEYIMTYSIGTPPVPALGIADTGSDIIWTQCAPCLQCFKQKLPLFQTKNSSTYKTVQCDSDLYCDTYSGSTCSNSSKTCMYSVRYGDGSFTNGGLATDTITLGSTKGNTVSIPNVTFGCGFTNGGIFSGGESGIVGLGSGKASLVSQLGPSIQGKFSYCLVLSNAIKSSKLSFGDNAVVSGEGVVSTPIMIKSPETYYYLTLEGISVGDERLKFNDSSATRNDSGEVGNIIIDSGTTFTFLPTDLYNKLENTLQSIIKLQRIPDPSGVLNLCYLSQTNFPIPDIVVNFKGADVKLNPENTFIRTSNRSMCLAFISAGGSTSIYGNLAQMNFLVGYDLEKKTLSFKPTDCTKS